MAKVIQKKPVDSGGAKSLRESIIADMNEAIESASRKKVTNYLSSGIYPLDLALSTKLTIDDEGNRFPLLGRGLPSGQASMIYGSTGAGKSTVSCSFLRQAQLAGGEAILIDLEPEGVTTALLDAVGVSPSLIKVSPDNAEETLDFMQAVISKNGQSPVPICIVVDSVGAMNSMKIDKKKFTETPSPGVIASLLHRFFLANAVDIGRSNNIYLIFTNYLKQSINYNPMVWMDPESYTGKTALGQYCNIIIRMNRMKANDIVSNAADVREYLSMRAEIIKNKNGDVGREFHIPFYVKANAMRPGLDDTRACLEFLIERNQLGAKTGQSYTINDESMTINKMRMKMSLEDNFYTLIREMVTKVYLEERGFSMESLYREKIKNNEQPVAESI